MQLYIYATLATNPIAAPVYIDSDRDDDDDDYGDEEEEDEEEADEDDNAEQEEGEDGACVWALQKTGFGAQHTERERERERERQTDRQTDTNKQTDRQTERRTDRDRRPNSSCFDYDAWPHPGLPRSREDGRSGRAPSWAPGSGGRASPAPAPPPEERARKDRGAQEPLQKTPWASSGSSAGWPSSCFSSSSLNIQRMASPAA